MCQSKRLFELKEKEKEQLERDEAGVADTVASATPHAHPQQLLLLSRS